MKPELNREYPAPEEETALANEMVELVRKRMEQRPPQPPGESIFRGQHAKQTGCVRGTFKIRDHLPDYLRHGVFQEPEKTFQAIIRFSNAAEIPGHDGTGAGRGMAIKLLDVEGKPASPDMNNRCQDFVMVNHPVFPFATPAEYVKFFHLRDVFGGQERAEKAAFLLTEITHPKHLLILNAIKAKKVASPLEITYWSGSPYRLGPEGGRAVKYSAAPTFVGTPLPVELEKLPAGEKKLPKDEINYLGDALQRHLASQAAVFDFRVQLQTDPVAMPVEDVSVEWDETVSTPIHVATLTIEAQDVSLPEGTALAKRGEGMAFSPWNALAEHRPIGGINRLRKAVYLASQELRAAKRTV